MMGSLVNDVGGWVFGGGDTMRQKHTFFYRPLAPYNYGQEVSMDPCVMFGGIMSTEPCKKGARIIANGIIAIVYFIISRTQF